MATAPSPNARLEAGTALTADGKPLSGMGTVFQDYDNDGRPDILVTVLPREVYALFHNDGNGLFSYRSLQAGLGLLSAASSGWGVGLEDFDNDGWKDLFVAQSHVLDNVEAIDHMLHYKETPLLALNHDGRFERADSGVSLAIAGRGAAFGDLNNDGWQDVVVTSLGGEPLVLYESRRPQVTGSPSLCVARAAIATAWAPASRSTAKREFATTSGSYVSASDKRLHFGLGDGRNSESRSSLALRHASNARRRQSESVSRNPRAGKMVTAAVSRTLAQRLRLLLRRRPQHLHAGVEADKGGQLDSSLRRIPKSHRPRSRSWPPRSSILAECCIEKRDYAAAVPPLKHAVELNPNLEGAHRLLGYALLAQGFAAEAIPHLEKAHDEDALGIALARCRIDCRKR